MERYKGDLVGVVGMPRHFVDDFDSPTDGEDVERGRGRSLCFCSSDVPIVLRRSCIANVLYVLHFRHCRQIAWDHYNN